MRPAGAPEALGEMYVDTILSACCFVASSSSLALASWYSAQRLKKVMAWRRVSIDSFMEKEARCG